MSERQQKFIGDLVAIFGDYEDEEFNNDLGKWYLLWGDWVELVSERESLKELGLNFEKGVRLAVEATKTGKIRMGDGWFGFNDLDEELKTLVVLNALIAGMCIHLDGEGIRIMRESGLDRSVRIQAHED